MNQDVPAITRDARSLSDDALEDLRRRVVAAVESGLTQVDAARLFGVSRQTVSGWVRAYRSNGDATFRPGRRGRPPGNRLALSTARHLSVIRTIATQFPDAVGLRYRLWTRQAVAELINREFQVMLGTTTVANYLQRWGFTAEPNLLRALRGQNAPTAKPRKAGEHHWIDGAEVLWATWRRLPVSFTEPDGRPADCIADLAGTNVLAAVSNRGSTFFMASPDPGDAAEVRELLARLTEQLKHRFNIVFGWVPTHRTDELRTWLAKNSGTAAVRFGVR